MRMKAPGSHQASSSRHSAANATLSVRDDERGSGAPALRGAIGDSVLFHVLQRVGGRDGLLSGGGLPRTRRR